MTYLVWCPPSIDTPLDTLLDWEVLSFQSLEHNSVFEWCHRTKPHMGTLLMLANLQVYTNHEQEFDSQSAFSWINWGNVKHVSQKQFDMDTLSGLLPYQGRWCKLSIHSNHSFKFLWIKPAHFVLPSSGLYIRWARAMGLLSLAVSSLSDLSLIWITRQI